MNTHTHMIGTVLLVAAAAAFAPAPIDAREPAAPASAERIVIDCERQVRPRQRQIAELSGQSNLGQVYSTRERTMAEVRRACRREGIARVLLVPAVPRNVITRDPRQIASVTRSGN